MTDSPATLIDPKGSVKPGRTWYMNFRFLRLDPAYHRLMPNEKVGAKQEFLASYDAVERRMPVATYALTGLRADCDILIWRVSPHLSDLHAMSARLHSSGLGKFLIPVSSYLGTAVGDYELETPRHGDKTPPKVIGTAPYLIVAPLKERTAASLAGSSVDAARIHVMDSTGLDGHNGVVALETPDPLALRRALEQWKLPAAQPTYTCILASLHEIVDSLG